MLCADNLSAESSGQQSVRTARGLLATLRMEKSSLVEAVTGEINTCCCLDKQRKKETGRAGREEDDLPLVHHARLVIT